MTDIINLPYPLYSSRPVRGKPLFAYARKGETVEVPNKKVTIFQAEYFGAKTEQLDILVARILHDIQNVAGDFRQEESIRSWTKVREEYPEQIATLVRIGVRASSGTYMRSLTEWFGKEIGVPALAYRITRTKLGEYILS